MLKARLLRLHSAAPIRHRGESKGLSLAGLCELALDSHITRLHLDEHTEGWELQGASASRSRPLPPQSQTHNPIER